MNWILYLIDSCLSAYLFKSLIYTQDRVPVSFISSYAKLSSRITNYQLNLNKYTLRNLPTGF